MMTYSYETQGRNQRSVITLCVMVAVIAALELIDTTWWITALVALVTLPLVMDVWLNLKTKFTLDEEAMRWKNRTQEAEVPLFEIDKVRFDGRLDLSVRVTIVLRDGSKVRVPYDVQPPHRNLESELQNRDVKTERHAFSLL